MAARIDKEQAEKLKASPSRSPAPKKQSKGGEGGSRDEAVELTDSQQ